MSDAGSSRTGTATPPSSPPGSSVPQRRSRSTGRRLLRELGLVLGVALVVAALLRAFVVQAFVVPTGSMEDTILKHQRIVVQKFGDIERGEVVVFEDPGGWIGAGDQQVAEPNIVQRALQFVGVLPSTATSHLVKRVIGLPGDTVACCDRRGRVSVNGAALDELSYLYRGDQASQTEFEVVVPRDTLWVMGDHRSDSGDSRCHVDDGTAFVPTDLVTGRAVAVAWPLGEAHRLPVPDTFADVPGGGAPPSQPDVVRVPRC